jgi:hypothetical protein
LPQERNPVRFARAVQIFSRSSCRQYCHQLLKSLNGCVRTKIRSEAVVCFARTERLRRASSATCDLHICASRWICAG